ncbi:PepSY domain-containing protein [Pontibacillus litoralis]|uniref:Peptidase M4 n=1 Tax=Pontibacillus litoralis JSM 072002 TaxID=1385512 RepID=A0A0A5HZX7_9BACI|nr:PepSY domain-containing protein [Pontibacillus litoralis]KGX89162.1 peptidase M4 [Pontibacillus litoralis JSM 072002]
MDWKKTLVAAGAGAIIGYAVAKQVNEYQPLSPEKALKIAKQVFKQQGPISGSWIHMKSESLEKDEIPYTVYRGGVSRSIDGQTKQYEFLVDAFTGTVLDVSLVA